MESGCVGNLVCLTARNYFYFFRFHCFFIFFYFFSLDESIIRHHRCFQSFLVVAKIVTFQYGMVVSHSIVDIKVGNNVTFIDDDNSIANTSYNV